jgi:hypothetical protein
LPSFPASASCAQIVSQAALQLFLGQEWSGFAAVAPNSDGFTERPVLFFELLKAALKRRERFMNLFCRKARNNVLLAIPVECFDRNYVDTLDYGLVPGFPKLFDPFPRCFTLENFGMAQKFQARLTRVIDQNQRHPIIRREIPRGDVLFVTPKIGESDRVIVD